jgi:salicylate hydroxylase
MSLHVLVAGAGLGGLALAHGLRKAGIDVTVYERDPSPDHRPQGYRIHIDAAGHSALAECLPEDLYELYVATSTRTPKTPLAVFFDHEFNQTRVGDTRAGDTSSRAPTAVNRLTLRQILLARLGDAVRFSHELVSYEADDTGVRLLFGNGRTATGDVLVAADGIHSVVRRGLVPHAHIHDTGVRAITGKTVMDAIRTDFPEQLYNSFTGVHGPDFRTLAMGVFQSRRPCAEAVAELAPDVSLDPVPDYLMWLQLAPVEDYPIADEELWRADPATLHRLALDMLDGWHPELLRLVERADQSATFPLSIRAVLPVPEWPATNVTMLGDAIHAMTPIGGRGGNTALSDAAMLARQLAAVDGETRELRSAIAEYESGMREHGYSAVVDSLTNAARALGAQSPYSPVR